MVQKHADLIYDVGLHVGDDTAYYLKKGFRVVAFEANQDLVELCSGMFRKELESGQLTIVYGAIVDSPEMIGSDGMVSFFKNEVNPEWGTVFNKWAERNEQKGAASCIIKVPAVNFADCLQQYGIPHYLKIDIEGMDTACLKALSLFPVKPDYVSIESDKVTFKALRREFDIFRELGYHSFQPVDQNLQPLVREPEDTQEGAYVGQKFKYGSSGLFGSDLPVDKWVSRRKALFEYCFVFLAYRLKGEKGIITRLLKKPRSERSFLCKCWLCILLVLFADIEASWYDTHARLIG